MKENKDIIEVYKKRVYNKLLIEKRAKIEEIKKNDKFESLVVEYNKNINELLEAEGRKSEIGRYDIAYYPSSLDIEEKIAAVEKEFKDAMDERDRVVEEVRALQEMYDYGELPDLYKKYGILQEDGKIYDYRDEK